MRLDFFNRETKRVFLYLRAVGVPSFTRENYLLRYQFRIDFSILKPFHNLFFSLPPRICLELVHNYKESFKQFSCKAIRRFVIIAKFIYFLNEQQLVAVFPKKDLPTINHVVAALAATPAQRYCPCEYPRNSKAEVCGAATIILDSFTSHSFPIT